MEYNAHLWSELDWRCTPNRFIKCDYNLSNLRNSSICIHRRLFMTRIKLFGAHKHRHPIQFPWYHTFTASVFFFLSQFQIDLMKEKKFHDVNWFAMVWCSLCVRQLFLENFPTIRMDERLQNIDTEVFPWLLHCFLAINCVSMASDLKH